jgi:hypothetical protein
MKAFEKPLYRNSIGSAGIPAGCPEGVLALGAAGVTPAGQPPGPRRYGAAREITIPTGLD